MRPIDGDLLMKTVFNDVVLVEGEVKGVGLILAETVDKAPTIDAVPVVRCRECKQGEVDDPDFPDQYYCHAGFGWNQGDFYCAYGEQKGGAE